jgi:beta-galactosidase/beta-glucuronidase
MGTLDTTYPRPDFDRSARWLDLGGPWEFARAAAGDDLTRPPAGDGYPESITVPFPWESAASGVAAAWLAEAWYRRSLDVPPSWAGERVILKFSGVHHRARVFVNAVPVAEHAGVGPFECDITDVLSPVTGGGRSGVLVVGVDAPIDKQAIAHGKQRSIPAADYDSCSFQPSSGIWQPVWLEPRPATFLRRILLRPGAALDGFAVTVQAEGPSAGGARLTLEIEGTGATVTAPTGADGCARLDLRVPSPQPWSPADPHLYRVRARLHSPDGTDEVTCTAGLRRIELAGDEIRLNGERLYLRGVLDQGYWPGCGLTAPSAEALQRDLAVARAAGYNLVRKHLKLEDPRWLHYADQAGMLVWAEPPSTSRFSPASVAAFGQGLDAMIERDANHPSIVIWGSFNEEWGLDWKVSGDPGRQQVVEQMAALVRERDPSRPVIDNSGWTHVTGDMIDWHYYEADLGRWAKNVAALVDDESAEIPVALHPQTIDMKPLLARPDAARGRPNLNSEYGMGFTSVERGWYLKWQTQELRRHDRLAGYVYTELYDIEHEQAGLLSADRLPKDLLNIDPADVNAETILILDVLPVQPGVDLELAGRTVEVGVRCSHHGAAPVSARLRWAWGPPLSPSSRPPGDASDGGPQIVAEPFVLSQPVQVTTELPAGWTAGRLHLWLAGENKVLAATALDVRHAPADKEAPS